MSYEIDQSIKIEETNKTSYIAIANGKVGIASISSNEKQLLQQYFRIRQKKLIFKLFSFASVCARLIIRYSVYSAITIDQEYFKHERQIKSFILQILRIKKVREPVIYFAGIGKSSSAHKEAYKAMKHSIKGNEIRAEEVIKDYVEIQKKDRVFDE